MTKRTSVGWIYFVVVLCTLLLRIASALDIYSALNIKDSDAFFSCVVQIAIFAFISVFLYSLTAMRRGEKAKDVISDFGFKKISAKNWLLIIPMCVCAIVVSSGISFVWQMALRMIGYTHIPSSTDYDSVGTLFKELFLVAVLPGFCEEIAHRGLIRAGYKECKWKFVLVSAVLFSLMHQNIVQTGYTFFFGATVALIAYYTDSIWGGILIHFANNAFSVFSEYVSQNGGVFDFINKISNWFYGSNLGFAVAAALVVVCACLLALFFFVMRKDAVKHERISDVPFENATDVLPLYKDIPFMLTVAVGICATAFSFAWGMMR